MKLLFLLTFILSICSLFFWITSLSNNNTLRKIDKPGKKEFLISLAAGTAHGKKGNMSQLEKYAKIEIKKHILPKLSATLAWGPVYTVIGKSPYYTNGCLILKMGVNKYAISIAGTNLGLSGWIYEDLKTRPMIKWPIINSSENMPKAYVFNGFHRGLQEILKGKDNSVTLTQILTELCYSKRCTVSIQGHSLGGALAPLLALYLKERYNFLDIKCTIFAGPTVGNTEFVKYYTRILDKNTVRYDNELDAIPRGFNLLNTVPDMYDEYMKLTTIDKLKVKSVVSVLQLDVLGLDPQPIKPDNFPAFTALFNYSLVTSNTFDSFLSQIVFQHVQAYCNYFQLDIIILKNSQFNWLP